MNRLIRWTMALAARTGLCTLLFRLSPGRRARILMYHGVSASAEPEAPFRGLGKHVHAGVFERQMAWLARHARPLSMERLVSMQERGEPLPRRAVAITFDDGYRNNFDVALPILRRHRIPAIVYVTTTLVEGEPLWVDRLDAALERCRTGVLRLTGLGVPIEENLPVTTAEDRVRAARRLRACAKALAGEERALLVDRVVEGAGFDLGAIRVEARPADTRGLTTEMVRALPGAGVGVGSHTVRHETLSRCPEDLLQSEVRMSRSQLETWLGEPVTHFAYPNGQPGDFDERTTAAVREAGYRSALTTVHGVVTPESDTLRLPRIPVNGGEGFEAFLCDLSGLRPAMVRARDAVRDRLRSPAHRRRASRSA